MLTIKYEVESKKKKADKKKIRVLNYDDDEKRERFVFAVKGEYSAAG